MRILACDDHPHITAIVEVTLKRDGHTIEICTDGLAAWERIRQCPPDLLICDCEMPIVSGLELCGRIREEASVRELPILLLTAKSLQLPQDWLRESLGVLAVMAKPFSPRALRSLVSEVERGNLVIPGATGSAMKTAFGETPEGSG